MGSGFEERAEAGGMLVGWSHHVAIQLSHSTHVAGIQGPDVGTNPSRTSDVPCQSLGPKLLSGQF